MISVVNKTFSGIQSSDRFYFPSVFSFTVRQTVFLTEAFKASRVLIRFLPFRTVISFFPNIVCCQCWVRQGSQIKSVLAFCGLITCSLSLFSYVEWKLMSEKYLAFQALIKLSPCVVEVYSLRVSKLAFGLYFLWHVEHVQSFSLTWVRSCLVTSFLQLGLFW